MDHPSGLEGVEKQIGVNEMQAYVVHLFAGSRDLGYWGPPNIPGPVLRSAASQVSINKATEVADYYNLNPWNAWRAEVETI